MKTLHTSQLLTGLLSTPIGSGRNTLIAASALLMLAAGVQNGLSAQSEGAEPAETQTNSVGMTMIHVPSGEFLMGSTPEEREWAKEQGPEWWSEEVANFSIDQEGPQHRVVLTRDFLMGATEVTVGQFRQFVEATGYETVPERDGLGGMYYDGGQQQDPRFTWRNPAENYEQTDDHPVTQLTVEDMEAFTQWLSEKEGRTYRLPTEAEWEYATRAGTQTRWFWGDNPADAGKFAVMARQRPEPVKSREPNAWGFYDLLGNVWEVTQDRGGSDYYANSPVEDPQGPEEGDSRIRRGGTYSLTDFAQLRTAFRKAQKPGYRGLHVGFRVVAPEPPAEGGAGASD